MKTIYNTYVTMESQEQCDRMKSLCVENRLPYWDEYIGFISYTNNDSFLFGETNGFGVYIMTPNDKTEVTEKQFIELLKNT